MIYNFYKIIIDLQIVIYLEVGSEVHIDMFDDRIEIYSPGGMYDGTKVQERDLMRVPSRRRNPVIADIFNRLKYMDRRGSGFKKILGDYRKQPQYSESKEPEFNSDNDSFLLVLKNLNYEKKAAVKTQESINKILEYMILDKEYALSEICKVLGLKETRTKEILKYLIEEDKIETLGGNRNRKYRRIQQSRMKIY